MADELWTPPPRPDMARSLYEQTEAERRKNPEKFKLDLERLMESARQSTGLSDFGGEEFIRPMERLLDSMECEADLNALGIKAGKGLARVPLENRLKMASIQKERPELFEAEVERPIFIVGGSRTGTTLLQRLLAVDPGNRALVA